MSRFAARRLERSHNIADLRAAARRVLPRPLFDFIDGAAEDERTAESNRAAFGHVTLRPRVADVREPDLGTTVLGHALSLPLLMAPCGLIRAVHPDGEPGVARAAEAAGTMSILSLGAGTPLEQVAEAMSQDRRWCQLYFFGSRDRTAEVMDRAAAAKFGTLAITVDSAVTGNRERDVRNRIDRQLGISLRSAVDMGPHLVGHPRWSYRFLRDGMPLSMPNIPGITSGATPMAAATLFQPVQPTWEDIAWAIERWDGPVAVKGIMTGTDARLAVDAGARAVVVSNHGGRQLDGLRASLAALPEVVDAVAGDAEVLLDSGVRRGTDIIKAVALGARAVLVGRPYVYGLAVGGEAGVARAIEILRAETVRAMRLLGCPSVLDLDRSWLESGNDPASVAV